MRGFLMRLTLRTLLAYLDDTLEPQEAKEIGQKVAESQPARELIERIRQVMRRRRLGAPPASGGDAEVDANIIAQYLDSSLSDEEITRVEEKCLADDQYLAEVASCHQILALVLGEPARIPPTARERMYGLVRDPVRGVRRKVAPVSRTNEKGQQDWDQEADEKLLLGLPRREADRNYFSWTPVLAGVLLLGALVALWMSMGMGMGGRELARLANSNGEKPASTTTLDAKKAEPAPKPADSPKAATPTDAAKDVSAPPPNGNVPAAAPPSVPPEKPEVKPDKTPAVERPPLTERVGTRRFELGHPSLVPGVPSLLLQREPGQPDWKRLPPEKGRISATDTLLMLPGYRGEIRFDSGVHLLLWGNLPELGKLSIPVLESEVTINSQPGVDLDFTLERGRVLLSNHKKEGPAVVRARFGEEVWEITLHDASSEVGLELLATVVPFVANPSDSQPDTEVVLLAFKGENSLRIRNEEYLLQPSSIVMWDSIDGTFRKPGLLPKLPEWYLAKNLATPASARETSQALENLSRISTTKTLDVALGECLQDNEAAARLLAVRCFAALGDVSALLSALNDDKRPELRAAAVDGLRHLLAASPAIGRDLERVAKEKNFTDKQVVAIRQLLQGFQGAQWAEPAVRSTVVDYLLHEKLLIRQLACSLLLRRIPEGQRIGYDAGADLKKRERACEEWRTLTQQPQKK
jgi:hypothetical protein